MPILNVFGAFLQIVLRVADRRIRPADMRRFGLVSQYGFLLIVILSKYAAYFRIYM